MPLIAVKDPRQAATRSWVVINTDEPSEEGPYTVDGYAVQWMPDTVEYYIGDTLIKADSPRRFFARKRDAREAIDTLLGITREGMAFAAQAEGRHA